MKIINYIDAKIKKLLDYSIQQNSNVKLLVAVSGGVDSTVLLDVISKIAKNIGFEIAVAHVNYNMHNNSKLALQTSKQQANNIGCKFYSKTINVKLETNFESRAREIRYNYLLELADKHNFEFVLTAHHLDDQIETIFMKEMQNSDWISKVGIREQLDKIYRPLLNIKKHEIISYAKQNNLKWTEDLTNTNEQYLRNKIRHSLLPKSFKKNPNIEEGLMHISAQSKQRLIELNAKIEKVNDSLVIHKNENWFSLNKETLLRFSQIEIKYILQTKIKQIFNMPIILRTNANWHEFILFLQTASIGSIFDLNENVSISKDRGKIYVYKTPLFKHKTVKLIDNINKWNESIFTVNSKMEHVKSKTILHYPKKSFSQGLCVRHWKAKDKIDSYRINKKVKVSNLFVNEKISNFQKNNYPIVTDMKDNIIWIPGIDHSRNIKLDENMVEIEWIQNDYERL